MSEKVVSYIKKYAIAFAILVIFTVVILVLRQNNPQTLPDWFSPENQPTNEQIKYQNLADAFQIPSVIMLMVGVLVWVANQGTFDMISYGLNRAKGSLLPFLGQSDETFYDYKVRKSAKRITGYSFLFISGGIYLIPGIIFNILYHFA